MIASFFSHTSENPKTGCIEWTGTLDKDGYGKFYYKGRTLIAHRVAWLIEHNEIPNKCVLHMCDNPKCVNPAHLFTGTQKENIHDMIRKGRENKTKFARGSKVGISRLKEQDIPNVREMYQSGMSQQGIADKLGVNQSTISNILNGKTWRQVA